MLRTQHFLICVGHLHIKYFGFSVSSLSGNDRCEVVLCTWRSFIVWAQHSFKRVKGRHIKFLSFCVSLLFGNDLCEGALCTQCSGILGAQSLLPNVVRLLKQSFHFFIGQLP